jgi:hypothetical protein
VGPEVLVCTSYIGRSNLIWQTSYSKAVQAAAVAVRAGLAARPGFLATQQSDHAMRKWLYLTILSSQE